MKAQRRGVYYDQFKPALFYGALARLLIVILLTFLDLPRARPRISGDKRASKRTCIC
jgi:hypothetical protein